MKLTPTQQRIADVLADGAAHTMQELVACLWDDMSENPRTTIKMHISNIRSKIAAQGLDVVGRGINGQSTYRLVRHISKGE